MPTVWPSCATYLLSCLEQSSLDVVLDILSGPISYTGRWAHMQVEDLLEMTACLGVFKLPNFEARGELALGFWRHINPHVIYKKLMLQSYFLTRDHFYICDKFAHGPTEKDEVYLCGYVSRLVCDEMAVMFLETCSQEAGQLLVLKKYKFFIITIIFYHNFYTGMTVNGHDHLNKLSIPFQQ